MSALARLATLLSLSSLALPAHASSGPLPLTASAVGFFCVVLFVLAYALVMAEEHLKLHKSNPVLVAAGVIWILLGVVYAQNGMSPAAEQGFRTNLLEYAELMLFLLVAMTYINALEERRLFDGLRAWLVRGGFRLPTLFWLTGGLAFCISPVADNLTTALLMCAVVLKVAEGERRFINLACINIVVAANAGGAFSPFGDITTLMVWQAGKVAFGQFFALFLPALLNFLVPALLMSLRVPRHAPAAVREEVVLARGARRIALLFVLTIATAVACHQFLHLPPVLGMLMGLGYLQCFGFYLRVSLPRAQASGNASPPFDLFNQIARAEWDTLLFFYGVVMCVGGLGFMGYLELVSHGLYGGNTTMANVIVGLLSAVIDNIPIMFAVLSMDPEMALGQWLLVTLTAGVGGSLLSIGSAAGVGLMGQARGSYTFMGHLRWLPAILLGYLASIAAHLWLNSALF